MSKMSCTDNAKVSDSGYTNTCANSQSQRSSGSSLSRHSNRSQNCRYSSGLPSTFGSSNGALPHPISKKKGREHNKKSKTLTTLCSNKTLAPKDAGQQTKTGPYTAVSINVSDQSLKQSEEIGTVESMDATDSGKHNNNPNFTTPKKRLGCQTNPLDNTSPNVNKEELGAIVSLHDGLVLHSTASLATVLGYSKNAWVGHSFIDSVHPKDKTTFVDKLASSVILPIGERENDPSGQQTSLYCRLRRHSKMDLNINIDMDISNDTTANYIPFHLYLKLKQNKECDANEKSQRMCLIITAHLVFSAYKVPEETIVSSVFSTSHTATGHLSHVDDNVVQYFGYLPQDMLGRSLFNYYHPADLPFIKDIYETIVRMEGSSFKSKPYRFISQNGGYIILETEWSSFINPWEKKLKFVVGHHRVLRGPKNPDVFQPRDMSQCESLGNMSAALVKQSQIIQNEICDLLAERIPKSTSVNDLSIQSNDLTTFMKSLIHEVEGTTTSTATTKITTTTAVTTVTTTTMITTQIPMMIADDRSISERNSVMLGEISPHHDCCDSKSSSETPPSYNQLNYNEKIERFFNSKPLLTSVDNSNEENVNLTAPNNDDINKMRSNRTPLAPNIPDNDSGGNGSNENLSNGSNNQTSSTSRDNSVNGDSNSMALDNFKLMTLTETVLNKHNHDMEKLLVQKHKERQTDIKNSNLNNDTRVTLIGQEEGTNKQHVMQCQVRGLKRSNIQNREDEFCKMAKYDETMKNYDKGKNSDANGSKITNDNAYTDNSRPNMNMRPQITVTHPLYPSTRDGTQCSSLPHILPVYYIPTLQIRENAMNPITSKQDPNQFLSLPVQSVQSSSCVPYEALPSSTSMIYSSPMILAVSTNTAQNESTEKLNGTLLSLETIVNCTRPASQITSIRAEPGSIMAMSESSKKPLSPGGHFLSCVSIDGGCSSVVGLPGPIDSERPLRQIDSSLEDSSDSSFYGSFLNTSTRSSYNPDKIFAPNIPETARRTASTQENLGMKEEDGGVRLRQQGHVIRIPSPWLKGVEMTPEIAYQYQMSSKTLAEVLKADMDTLKQLHQPVLVNDQLDQLYLDLKLAGFGANLILDDDNESDDNDDINDAHSSPNVSPQREYIRRKMTYSEMAIVYEENAPLLLSS